MIEAGEAAVAVLEAAACAAAAEAAVEVEAAEWMGWKFGTENPLTIGWPHQGEQAFAPKTKK